MDNLGVRLFDMQFHLIVVSIFLKTCVKEKEKTVSSHLNSTFIETPGFFKQEEILKCEFLHQPYAICALRSEFRLIVISAIINRRLMICALTFFLMIFFSNSGEPLMKFSFTNSSSSTSWSFLNPSSQKKKRINF